MLQNASFISKYFLPLYLGKWKNSNLESTQNENMSISGFFLKKILLGLLLSSFEIAWILGTLWLLRLLFHSWLKPSWLKAKFIPFHSHVHSHLICFNLSIPICELTQLVTSPTKQMNKKKNQNKPKWAYQKSDKTVYVGGKACKCGGRKDGETESSGNNPTLTTLNCWWNVWSGLPWVAALCLVPVRRGGTVVFSAGALIHPTVWQTLFYRSIPLNILAYNLILWQLHENKETGIWTPCKISSYTFIHSQSIKALE